MSTWIAFAAPVIAAVALIALLGLPLSFALRLRGFAIAVVAVPAAFAVLAVSTLLMPYVGLGWSLIPAVIITAALGAVLLLLKRWFAPPVAAAEARSWRALWVPLASAGIGALVIMMSLLTGLGSAEAISQTFDAGFHLNAVRYVLDTGAASPFQMELTSPGAPVFYPTLWHAFVALIVQLTGVSIPMATNAALLVVSAVVWPIGAMALGRAVAGPSLRVTLITGALVAAFPNFPLFLASYGVIYPNILALALLPFVLVAALQILNLGPARRAIPLSVATRWLLFLGALGAAALAHPSVIHAILVWGTIPAILVAVRAFRGTRVPGADGLLVTPRTAPALRRIGAIVGLIALVAVIAVAWIGGRTTDNVWQGFYGPRSAALQLIGGTPHLEGHAWTVSILVLLGAVIAWRHRTLRWVIGSAATLALFYYIADGFHTSDWRSLFLSPWYNDPRRLASLVPFGALPLAVLGASAAWTMLRPGLRRIAAAFSVRPTRATRVLTIGALVFLLAAGQAGALSTQQALAKSYDIKHPMLLDEDERALLERIDDAVPAGETIANNPLNGSALSYALADRSVLFPHAGGFYDPRGYELIDSFVRDPELACRMSEELEVNYVLDFGQFYVLEPTTRRAVPFKHMKRLEESPILTEVDREGDAALFQISGC